jgi:hypothetical protein
MSLYRVISYMTLFIVLSDNVVRYRYYFHKLYNGYG